MPGGGRLPSSRTPKLSPSSSLRWRLASRIATAAIRELFVWDGGTATAPRWPSWNCSAVSIKGTKQERRRAKRRRKRRLASSKLPAPRRKKPVKRPKRRGKKTRAGRSLPGPDLASVMDFGKVPRAKLPTRNGEFTVYGFKDPESGEEAV